MFDGCSSLLDIEPLKKWNVSNQKYIEDLLNNNSDSDNNSEERD